VKNLTNYDIASKLDMTHKIVWKINRS